MTELSRLPTGCDALDQLLEGGIESGTITQIYGPPGAGKTNVALGIAVETAARGERVLVIDAEGISPDRLGQLLGARVDPAEQTAVTDRIIIREVYTFEEQARAIKDVEQLANEVSLVIVDSLTGFYRLARGTDEREGDALRTVTRQVTHLLSMARKYDLAILLTNQVFTDPDTSRAMPLGGHTLGHWSGAIIRLDRFRGGNRRATLEKHRSLAAGETVGLRITEDGIISVDLP